MPPEKAEALVIRLADFSESSRVVTFFTREFGKSSALAKGVKRLKGPFEGSIDLLAHVQIILYRKDHDALDLVTEAQLVSRFAPPSKEIFPLYAGYYVAELLDIGTEPHDPHAILFDEAIATLDRLSESTDPRFAIMRFELLLLREIGNLPGFTHCVHCETAATASRGSKFWVTASGLICEACGRPEYEHAAIQPGSVRLLQQLSTDEAPALQELSPTASQIKEVRRIVTAAVTHALDRKPKMLGYLKF
ncbi:MAG: DNA repair protein RecO [Planctomycetota bacterium]|jgi:DNA repair protein RecO (recombination protein O)|nr:MAG: DNA repair protein RecO [Planctomycetota bacterium]